MQDRDLENLVRSVVENVLTPAPEGAGARVAIGADHGGFPLKEQLRKFLADEGWIPVDMGTGSTDAVDYPEYAARVASVSIAEGSRALAVTLVSSSSAAALLARASTPALAMLYAAWPGGVSSAAREDMTMMRPHSASVM